MSVTLGELEKVCIGGCVLSMVLFFISSDVSLVLLPWHLPRNVAKFLLDPILF